jgi:D-arabinose 1-dehydrogenase-like Zn-dependent alcohol dehydrogenase
MCREYPTVTYNAFDRIDGSPTYGGFSKHLVVHEEFALRMPDGLDPSRAAPLLCAGITVYSPLRLWNVGPGSRVGVVGIGGLGHLAVRFAAALGAAVTVITRTDAKAAEARALGADHVVVSTSAEAMATAASSFDVIIDTIPARRDVSPYVELLDIEGVLVIVGQLGDMDGFSTLPLLTGRRRITGSPSGGPDRDAGDARFLRQEADPAGVRDRRHGRGQRGVRATGARRRALPLRDRHGLPVAGVGACVIAWDTPPGTPPSRCRATSDGPGRRPCGDATSPRS